MNEVDTLVIDFRIRIQIQGLSWSTIIKRFLIFGGTIEVEEGYFPKNGDVIDLGDCADHPIKDATVSHIHWIRLANDDSLDGEELEEKEKRPMRVPVIMFDDFKISDDENPPTDKIENVINTFLERMNLCNALSEVEFSHLGTEDS